jgi:hypothetical protein
MILIYLILTVGIAILLMEITTHIRTKITLLYAIFILWRLLRREKNKRERVAIRETLRLSKQLYKQTTFFPK